MRGGLAPAGRLASAFDFALSLHRDQIRRKTRVPTMSHLMAVTALVLENGGNEDEAMGSLLHDGPEDCGGRQVLVRIRRRFGPRVADIVAGCTDSLDSPSPPWSERKREYLRHLPAADESVRLVSLADKVHNVRALVREHRWVGDDLWRRFSVTPGDTLWYYESLLEVFTAAPGPRLARLTRDLSRAVDSLRPIVGRQKALERPSGT